MKSLTDLQKPDVNLFIASYMTRTGVEPSYAEVVEYAISQMLKREEIYKNLISKMKSALKYVCRVTYGTELINSDEENNEILARHFFNSADTARKTLAEVEKIESELK